MQINNNKPPEKQDAVIKGQKVGGPLQAIDKGPAEKISAKDKVELSGKARGIAEMFTAINQLPEVRAERIQEIEQSISKGTYKIDAFAIASRMVDEVV